MDLDTDKIRANAEKAETDDLLDRVTAFRVTMEPEAIAVIERVLRSRGVGREQIDAHAAQLAGTVPGAAEGKAEKCSFCRRPAVATGWYWHRLFGKLPLFPLTGRFCQSHLNRRWGEPATSAHPRT